MCYRQKNCHAQGRNAPRHPGSFSGSQAARVPVVVPALKKPVGRPSPPSNELLSLDDWWSQCLDDANDAHEIELSSYTYDHPGLQQILERRLRSKRVKLNLYVDREMMFKTGGKYMKPRVTALHTLGAKVFICNGLGALGSYHCKGAVIDRRVLYTGNSNFTYKSKFKKDSLFKMKGEIVGHVCEDLATHRQIGRLWGGIWCGKCT